jgi:hypothetical protein
MPDTSLEIRTGDALGDKNFGLSLRKTYFQDIAINDHVQKARLECRGRLCECISSLHKSALLPPIMDNILVEDVWVAIIAYCETHTLAQFVSRFWATAILSAFSPQKFTVQVLHFV